MECRRLLAIGMFALLTLATTARAQIESCTAPTTSEPPISTPTGNLGSVDFTWSCAQQDCTFAPVLSEAWVQRGLRDINWYFLPEGVHVHTVSLRQVLHHFPVTFNQTTYVQRAVFTFATGDVIPVEHLVDVTVTPAAAYWAENASQMGLSVFLEPGNAELNYVQYHWDFGDGTTNVDDPVGGHARSVFCKTYELPGLKTVTLTTYDYRQEPHTVPVVDSYTKTFYVGNLAPVADGTASVSGSTVAFNASLSRDEVPAGHKWNPNRQSCITFTPMTNESLSTYEWDFGDGSYGSGATTTHTYTRPGAKTAILTVVDRAGAVAKKTFTFTIADNPPAASIAFNCTGRRCQLDGTSSRDDFDSITTWEWTVNGTRLPQTTAVATYDFPSDGDFGVSLSVRDEMQSSPAVSRIASVRTSAPSPPLGFIAMTPCRAYDSRAAGSGGPLLDRVERLVEVGAKCGSVPQEALAVALEVTVVNPSAAGHLKAYSDGTQVPSIPVLNFDPSTSPIGNDVVVGIANPVSKAGLRTPIRLLAYIPSSGGSTNVLVDITGYFVDSGTAPSASFVSVPPCRLMDSRDAATYPGAAALNNGTAAYVKIQNHTRCGIPADLGDGAAAALNLTAVAPTASGEMMVTPSTVPAGATSTVSAGLGKVVASGALTLLGRRAADDLAVTYVGVGATSSSHYLLDITGYFRTSLDKNLSPRLWYRAIQPCRVADTRDPLRGETVLTGGVISNFQVRGNCGVPADAEAVFVNATAISPNAGGFLQLWPAGTPPPGTSVVHFASGSVIANGTVVALGPSNSPLMRDLAARTTMSNGSLGTAHVVLDVLGYFSSSTTAKSVTEQE